MVSEGVKPVGLGRFDSGPLQNHNIRRYIVSILRDRCIRLTPSDLKRAVQDAFPLVPQGEFRSAIRDLVSKGEILYTNHFNTTHFELGHHRPFQISKRIVVIPANGTYTKSGSEFVIRLNDGTAFGVGDHPTTRMMVQGIDETMSAFAGRLPAGKLNALDIGAGTGILSIAAACLGISKVVAVDIDPAACLEARKNAALNGVQDNIFVTNDIHQYSTQDGYSYLFANLRPPTLRQLFPMMCRLSADTSIWILSGFRDKQDHGFFEQDSNGVNYEPIWGKESCGWRAIALKREKRALAS